MRIFKRVVSAVLLLCLLVTLLPAMSFVRAAEVVQRYELDTDGIEVGATYLIVNTNATGTGNALRFYYGSSSSRDLRNQTVTIENDGTTTYISAGFTNEAECQFQFSGTKTGRITHGSYSVNLNESKYVTGNPSNTLTFNDLGSGRFQIYYTSLWRNYYLQYNNSDWARSNSFSTSNTSNAPSVYLFKLTETVVGYDITFNGNGYTEGTLPDNEIGLSYGATYTLPTGIELRKDVGEDTWLFLGWNSLPDGSGTEYAQGETITVTGDLTLYADWYLQTKYTVSMITYLDGKPTDVEKISGTDKQFFAKLEGDDTAPYLPLTKSAEGTYTTKVADNGTYVIYSKTDGSAYEEVHGHKVVIFNQDGSTECMHYSVVYDAAGGEWKDGEAPSTQYHHFQESVHVIDHTPTLAGNRFLGWEDADGKHYAPGQSLTSSIDRPIKLTALWEKALTVTVNVTINHNAGGGADNSQGMHDFLLTLLREENNVNLPILAQDANENGNLWNKVTVLPANNIYYEDSFVTTEDTTQNGIEGFTFTGAWSIVGTDSGNTEVPEHLESSLHGKVHGWTDSLSDDTSYSDGSAHGTGLNGEMGAQAQFTFTGTGIEVYTRTNSNSGIVVAVLNRKVTGADGTETTIFHKSLAMDNLAASGDYYQIPTIAFKDLPYGTYSLQLIATGASTATGGKRCEYYIDGIRVHNPLGNNLNTFQSETIKGAYDLETFAVFTEVRDILLDYDDFNADLSNSSDGKMGAVFIDWIQEEQGDTSDPVGTGVPTYTVGTFKTYGPKNEVYLSAGQAIVLRVAEGNQYFVGLKSLTGKPVTVNVSGRDMDEPTTINLTHTTDLYYQVTPIAGYIVIQNGNTDDAILSISNLRTTNLNGPAENGGVLDLEDTDAVELLTEYTVYMQEKRREEQLAPPSEPEEELPDAQDQAQSNIALANSLFASVRQWLELEEEVETV